MIRDFETVKAQLAQLASVINSFKSEAVQLRVIDLILGPQQDTGLAGTTSDDLASPKKSLRRTKSKGEGSKEPPEKKKRIATSGGAVALLSQLVETPFFDKPKTIKDIIDHIKLNHARTFKANEFSGKLARLVRSKGLVRKKNADKQYEYKKQ